MELNKNQDMNKKQYRSEYVAQPGPIFEPKDCHLDFITGMQYHAPFIYTDSIDKTDLDRCIICTFPPHYVFKVRVFRTVPISKTGNNNELQRTIRAEVDRCSYLSARWEAAGNGMEAQKMKKSVRKYIIEDCGAGYDQELDEPRLVGKVPGINVYLELVGCLDRVTMDEISWDGEHGVRDTMERALAYALHFWTLGERKRMATNDQDPQLLPEWKENYNSNVAPTYQPKNGLGYTNFDAARRFGDKRY